MIMMMRADDSYVPAKGCEQEEILSCLAKSLAGEVDYDACKAACANEDPAEEEDVVKAGTLTVSVKDYSSSVVSAPLNGTVIFNAINLKASEEITVNTLTLSKIGLSNNNSVDKVWFEKDGVRISSKASISTDGTATVNFTKGLTVKSNETIDLVASLQGAAGAEVAFKIDSLNSTAEKVSISNATTTTYRTTTYNVAEVLWTETAVPGTYKLGEQDEILFAKATVENESLNTNIVVKSITFNSANSDVENILRDVRLVKDGKTISKNVTFDGKKVTVTLDDTIESSKRSVYSLYAKTNSIDDAAETFDFALDSAEGLVAYEATTNFRAAYDDNTVATAAVSTVLVTPANRITINGGKIVFANDSSFATTVTAGQGYSDVQIAKGTLTLAEPVMFNRLTVSETTALSNIKSMVLEVAGTRYNATIDTTTTPGTVFYYFDDIYVNKTASVKLFVSLTNTAAGTITLTNINGTALNAAAGEYQNNGTNFANTDVAGTIKVAGVTVKNSTFTITNDKSSTVTTVLDDADPVVIFDGSVTSTKQDISLSNITVKNVAGTTALSTTNYANITLKIGGKTVTKKCDADNCTLAFPVNGITVNGTATPFTVEVEPILTADDYQFTVEADGLDANNNTATAAAVNAALLTVSPAAAASISAASQGGDKVILAGGNKELLKFNVYAQNGSVALDDVEFDITSITAANDISVYLDGEKLEGTATLAAGTYNIGGLAETLSKGTHEFVIKANVVDTLANSTITVSNLEINTTVGPNATSTIAPNYYVVTILPELSVASDPANNQMTVAIKLPANATAPITITDFFVDDETITALYLNNQELNEYDGDDDIDLTVINKAFTLNPGETVNVVMKVTAAGTAKLKGILYDTLDTAANTFYVGDTTTNFPRGNFQVTYKS